MIRLVRNHEIDGAGTPFTSVAYDPRAGGGTTTLEFDTREGDVDRSWASLSGTVRNCAGGPTPWGSWLTCEETLAAPAPRPTAHAPHGYIFEVPAFGTADPTPLKAMGRFSHEAVAIDPDTGIVYETEDADTARASTGSCPTTRATRRRRHAADARHRGTPRYNTALGQVPDEPLDVVWVTIDDPDPGTGQPQRYAQGAARAAPVRRLEGAWWGHGKIYFVSTAAATPGRDRSGSTSRAARR